MTYTDLRKALADALHEFPPRRFHDMSVAPWPVSVRLPDGTECEIVAVRPGSLGVVLDAEPRRTS